MHIVLRGSGGVTSAVLWIRGHDEEKTGHELNEKLLTCKVENVADLLRRRPLHQAQAGSHNIPTHRKG